MKLFRSLFRLFLSLILGASLAFFAYSYWGWPYGSRRLLAISLLFFVVGAVGYQFVFSLFLKKQSLIKKEDRWKVFLFVFIIAPVLFFLSSIQWQREGLLGYPLLPTYEFEIEVISDLPEAKVSVVYFGNSFGDISYDDLEYQGWVRDDDVLRLVNINENFLKWRGKIGEKTEIYFKTKGTGQIVVASNLDLPERLSFSSDLVRHKVRGKIPWIASRLSVLGQGLFHFAIGIFIALLVIWPERIRLYSVFSESLGDGLKDRFVGTDFYWILGLVALALGMRIFNLGDLPPHLEEYQHLNAAKEMLNGASWESLYQRSFFLVTFPVYLFFKVFGVDIAIARLPGVIINSFAIIPIYLLMRRVDRRLAIFASFLYATSPYVIAFSRAVREYAYYPFYFYWVIFLMLVYLDALQDSVFLWKTFFKKKQLLLLFSLMLPLVYSQYDAASTLKVLFFSYGIFIFFVLKEVRKKSMVSFSVLAIILGVLVFLIGGIFIRNALVYVSFNNYYIPFSQGDFETALNYFFYNPLQQWYFDRLVLIPLLLLLFALGYGLFSKKNITTSFLSFLFLFSLVAFLLLFDFVEGVRFYLHVQLWYILLVAIGGYGLFRIIQEYVDSRKKRTLILVVLILITFNPYQIILSQLKNPSPIMPITSQSHDDFEATHNYLADRVSDEDVLISYDYARYAYFVGDLPFAAYYGHVPRLAEIVSKHSRGWLVVSEKYYPVFQQFLPLQTFWINDIEIVYYGAVLGEHVDYVWHWQ